MIMELEKLGSEMSLEELKSKMLGEPDQNVSELFFNPKNPSWVEPMSITDSDGAKLFNVEGDPYGNVQHILREDGTYSNIFPSSSLGWLYEETIDGKVYLVADNYGTLGGRKYIDFEAGEIYSPVELGLLGDIKEVLLSAPKEIKDKIMEIIRE